MKFVTVNSSDVSGSAGLEDCVMTGMKTIGVSDAELKQKFAGVTTDSKSSKHSKAHRT